MTADAPPAFARGALRAGLVLSGLGLILAAMSEAVFYPIEMGGLGAMAVVYGVAALFAVAALDRYRQRGWVGLVLAAALLGWTIEGVVVWQSYEAFPFSLVWTALAWHGVISVGLGVVGLRMALLSERVWLGVVAFLAMGLGVGVWGAYGWSFLAFDPEGGPVAHSFLDQVVVATAMIAAGHLLLNAVPEGAMPPWITVCLGAVALVFWALAWAAPFFPISIFVPLLMGGSFWALSRLAPGRPVAFGKVPLWRFAGFVLVPAVAVPVQAVTIEATWLTELNWIVGGICAIVAVVLWLWALFRALRQAA